MFLKQNIKYMYKKEKVQIEQRKYNSYLTNGEIGRIRKYQGFTSVTEHGQSKADFKINDH